MTDPRIFCSRIPNLHNIVTFIYDVRFYFKFDVCMNNILTRRKTIVECTQH